MNCKQGEAGKTAKFITVPAVAHKQLGKSLPTNLTQTLTLLMVFHIKNIDSEFDTRPRASDDLPNAFPVVVIIIRVVGARNSTTWCCEGGSTT